LILLRSLQADWKAALAHAVSLLACILLWTFLATGSLHDPAPPGKRDAPVAEVRQPSRVADVPAVKRHGDWRRHNIFYFFDTPKLHHYGDDAIADPLFWIVNRVIWVPYITAYDWLRFHDDVLDGRLTLGRQIGIFSRLLGSSRLPLEQMVYEYQYGASPGGAGASNTVFFVDAKVAFGWIGALVYCVAFTLFSAVVFTSANPVAQVASVTSFFTAALSPLTATLLSGGLFFFLVVSLLFHLEPYALPAGRANS
jgi:hypothetical protein